MKIPPSISDAIFSLCPSAAFRLDNPLDLSTLEWIIPKKERPEENGVPFVGVVDQDADEWWEKLPTQEEILIEFNRLEKEFEMHSYARNRMYSYPSIGDQLDALFHAGVFPDDMAAQIQAVKDQYPKPEQLDG